MIRGIGREHTRRANVAGGEARDHWENRGITHRCSESLGKWATRLHSKCKSNLRFDSATGLRLFDNQRSTASEVEPWC
jgi:hypothetical protein